MKKLILISLTILALSSCTPPEYNFDTIEFRHESAEVAPEYQRSYFITATPDNIHVVIDGHNGTILDTNFNNSNAQFAQYDSAYKYLNMGIAEYEEDCNGCSTRHIELRKDNRIIYNAKWNQDTHPALQRLINTLLTSIPNFGELLAKEEKGINKK